MRVKARGAPGNRLFCTGSERLVTVNRIHVNANPILVDANSIHVNANPVHVTPNAAHVTETTTHVTPDAAHVTETTVRAPGNPMCVRAPTLPLASTRLPVAGTFAHGNAAAKVTGSHRRG